jgi:hypothetical protein
MADLDTTAGSVGWENAPSHYRGTCMENFDVWDAYELDAYLANAFKYLARCQKKGSLLNDLRKARHYIEEYLLRLEDGRIGQPEVRSVDLAFTLSNVVAAFGLRGYLEEAVSYLLLSRITSDPGMHLRASRRYIDRLIKRTEDQCAPPASCAESTRPATESAAPAPATEE